MSNFTPPTPDLPQSLVDFLDDFGVDSENAVYALGFGSADPDLRAGGFPELEDLLNYLEEAPQIVSFSRYYYDENEDIWYVAIPENSA